MNNKIIKMLNLQKLKYKNTYSKLKQEGKTSEAIKFNFKIRALQKGIDTIIKYNKKIKEGKDIAHLNGIGKGIISRIDEILKSGTLVNVKNVTKNDMEKEKIINLFTTISGVGKKKAETWYLKKYKTISDVKKNIKLGNIKSTNHIDIGLKYYSDFKKRIPRNEIKKFNKIFSKLIKRYNKDLIYKICGSYRRKLKTSGDIDIIITNPKVKNNIHKHKYLSTLIKICTDEGLIIDNLTSLGEKKYMGVCKINNLARRIDIRCFNPGEFITALLYFTGSRNFNIYIRSIAIKKGYLLNEYYLMNKKTKKKIKVKSEDEIFKKLDIKYLKPSNRDFT